MLIRTEILTLRYYSQSSQMMFVVAYKIVAKSIEYSVYSLQVAPFMIFSPIAQNKITVDKYWCIG